MPYADRSSENTAVNPAHYRIIPKEAYERFPSGLQYQDIMLYVLLGHDPRVANLMAQTFKYMFRAGKKDPLLQELEKAAWYLNYLINEVVKDDENLRNQQRED